MINYCSNCGTQLNSDQDVCLKCGKNISKSNFDTVVSQDNGSIGWGLLGFFFPFIGLILYFIWKETKPLNAKAAGKGSLIGVLLAVVYGFFIGLSGLAS
jgi:DNA-directed RNA polymerase subunit RPC12/RpoP